jgi:endonuclease/exonuclease/phosphatase family metal-dependent hydrolase
MSSSPGASAADPTTVPPTAELRIGSYNIHRAIGRDRRCSPVRIAQVINELACDTVGLQEVTSRPGAAPELHQLEFLAQTTGMTAIAGAQIGLYDGEYGCVLLTRRPVLSIARHDLSVTRKEPRSALDVELDVAGVRTRVLLIHLGLSLGERREQVRRILRVIAETPRIEPVLLLGDVNEWLPRGRTLRWLHAEFGTPPAPRSFPARWPILALDRIWVRPRSALLSVAAHRSPTAMVASDHLPIKAVVDPQRSARVATVPGRTS